MNYTGIYYFSLPENDDLALFYENPNEFANRLKENQYLILENNEYEAIDFYKKKMAGLREFHSQQLEIDMKLQSNLVTLNRDVQWIS